MQERRYSTDARIERRAASDDADAPAAPVIVGRAATYDAWTVLYESKHTVVRERFAPGAFKNALSEGQDVRALFNHDPNFVLGRTRSNTLRLTEEKDGLHYEADPPDTQTIRDLVLAPMARGDVSGSSFAFRVRQGGEEWRDYEGKDGREYMDRSVADADLFDVSPVTYPAYEESTSGLRSVPPERRGRVEARERAMSRPATPVRDGFRRWLDGAALAPAPGRVSARAAGKDQK